MRHNCEILSMDHETMLIESFMIMSESWLSEGKSVEMLTQENLIKQILIQRYVISVTSVRSKLKLERKEAQRAVQFMMRWGENEKGREFNGYSG